MELCHFYNTIFQINKSFPAGVKLNNMNLENSVVESLTAFLWGNSRLDSSLINRFYIS